MSGALRSIVVRPEIIWMREEAAVTSLARPKPPGAARRVRLSCQPGIILGSVKGQTSAKGQSANLI